MSDFNPCLTEECKTRCDSYGVYCEDICIKEIQRKDAAIAELVGALKVCVSRLEFANKHIDCEDEIAIVSALIAKYDTTTKET